MIFFSPVRIHNRREQSCDCSLLRDILRLNERGLLCRRGFAIWLHGAGKNGPLCVRPGRSGAVRASQASRVPDGAGGAGAMAKSAPSARRVPAGLAGGLCAGTDAGRMGPAPNARRTEAAQTDAPTAHGPPARAARYHRTRAGLGPRRGPALRLRRPHCEPGETMGGLRRHLLA